MSYLLDKKLKRRKFLNYLIIFLVVTLLFLTRNLIFRGFSQASHFVFRPIVVIGNSLGNSIYSTKSFFISKKTLLKENENLKNQILQSEADRANYLSVVNENIKLKEILGRKNENNKLILSGILSQVNQSIYGTLIIGVKAGFRVFALGNIPIGRIAEVYPKTSKVVLYSSSGEKTEVVVSGRDTFVQAVGRGGGNFELAMPRDFLIEKGAEVNLPGIHNYIFGVVEDIISDPRDSFQKALLVSPVNISELKFVQVEI